MPKTKLVKFLPSYVGSKAYWVDYLSNYKTSNIVELFAGSAVLSANLASSAILNDLDKYVSLILKDFDKQIVPEIFTKEDYFEARKDKDWYKYAFCLQKMSFSGVFRYSKNGYNVPIKPIDFISERNAYLKSLEVYKKINPTVLNRQYYQCNEYITKESVVIIDPPYETGQASYNSGVDYEFYWNFIRLNENAAKAIIIFDYDINLPFKALDTRNMRVNGALKGAKEGIFIFENSLKEGQKGEELFLNIFKDRLVRLDGKNADFKLLDGRTVELKSDYYDNNKTSNFFFERYSDKDRLTNGGPWQALDKNIDLFVYWFPKNKTIYVFNTKKLVEKLNSIVESYELVDIPNKSWITSGYKIPRNYLQDIILQEKRITNV